MTSKTVFRVVGIPEEVAFDTVKTALIKEADGEIFGIKSAIIVPSCYDRSLQVALIQFDPLPVYLRDCNDAGWESYGIEVESESGKRFDVTIDKDFFGLTQLYRPTTDHITLDIVAVTGLAGHPFGSWRGRDNVGRMWLRDFLSVDLPNCRTMTYGYDSRFHINGIHKIKDYCRGLLVELMKARSSVEEMERPIVFIGHSFGGIVVAQSLVRSQECSPQKARAGYSIYQATRGILFFGTPHRGFIVDDLLIMLDPQEECERVDLINSISENSQLGRELEKFIAILKLKELRIISFYETQMSRRLVKGKNGFSRSGEYWTTVNEGSALLNLGSRIEKTVPVDADHTEIVKFKNKEDPAYSTTIFYLREFEKNL